MSKLLGFVLGLVLACIASSSAASAKNCVTVTVVDPLELPDGSIHAAGSLTLCSIKVFSPVAQFHQVSVDGMPVGFLLSRLVVSEGPVPDDPLVTFHRDRKGRLHLIGYAWPAGKRSQTYLLQDPRPSRGLNQASAPLEPPTEQERSSPPLLAAIAP